MTDQEIKKLLLSGDIAAFESIYRELSRPVYTVALRITGSRESAEDILQDTFIKLFTLPPDKIQKPRAYIFAIAHNLALNSIKDKGFEAICEDMGDTAEQENKITDRIALNHAMGMLTPVDAAIVNLHLVGGLKFREVAEILKIPLGTALWKYRRAIKDLQEILKEDYL